MLKKNLKVPPAVVAATVVGIALSVAPGPSQNPGSKEAGKKQAARIVPIPMQAQLKLARESKNEFRNPEESAYRCFTELRLTTGKFPSGHPPEGDAPDQFELLCYNGKPVGPTIRVRRGTTFHVRLKNDLKLDDNPSGPTNPTPPNDQAEKPHDLCTTNLHTHGLHVSPANNADNILDVQIAPGQEFTFEYTVPADHPSGTFWYHPHRHGSVAYQLSNGLAGALIVEGTRRDGIPDLDDVPEIAAAGERIFVFQLYTYRKGEDGVGRIDASKVYNVTPDLYACPAITFSGKDPGPDAKPQATAINGVINPVIHIAPGRVERWRLIHAAWDLKRDLTFIDGAGNPTEDIRFQEIALDGLATGTMEAKSKVELAPGQRSDVLIQAPLLREGEGERIYYLMQDPADASVTPHNVKQAPLYLAQIVVRGRPHPMKLPDRRVLAKCRPFAPIQDNELSKMPSFPNGLRFAADDGGADKPPHYTINGKAYLKQANVQIRLDTAEEWTVSAENKGSNHPFHIHVNPFQVVRYTDAAGNVKPMNVWRDTLYIQENESYTIRSRFRDFVGMTVLHCHILDHEDQGMMIPIEFIPPYQKPAAPGRCPKLKPASTRAPPLQLPDPAGKVHTLAEFRGRKVVLVFFQGLECAHCAENLRDLVRQARGPNGFDAEIIAVSSRRVSDGGRALRLLGVSGSDPFLLLTDKEHGAFRALGCYYRGPLHGVFLIDGEGVIRASYQGKTPFGNTTELVRLVANFARGARDK